MGYNAGRDLFFGLHLEKSEASGKISTIASSHTYTTEKVRDETRLICNCVTGSVPELYWWKNLTHSGSPSGSPNMTALLPTRHDVHVYLYWQGRSWNKLAANSTQHVAIITIILS